MHTIPFLSSLLSQFVSRQNVTLRLIYDHAHKKRVIAHFTFIIRCGAAGRDMNNTIRFFLFVVVVVVVILLFRKAIFLSSPLDPLLLKRASASLLFRFFVIDIIYKE